MWIGRGEEGIAMGGMEILAAVVDDVDVDFEAADVAAMFEASTLCGVMLVWRILFCKGCTASQDGFWS